MQISKYNLIVETDEDEKYILYNQISGALLIIDEIHKKLIENIFNKQYVEVSEIDKEVLDNLVLGKFIINDDENELDTLEYNNNMAKYSDNVLNLTILPTLDCNFNCTYCFEKHNSKVMNQETENALVCFVERNLKHNGILSIVWFGGEPLLQKQLISRITDRFIKICETKNATYKASIITNGFLIDDNIEEFLNINRILNVQITLDGTKENHDSKRKLRNGQGTYDQIVKNILSLKNITKVSLRINVDINNSGKMEELIEELAKYPIKDYVSPYFAKIEAYTSVCENIKGTCLTTKIFSIEEIKLYELLNKNGFKIPKYPVGKEIFCGANNINFYVIEPDGKIKKCWNAVGIDEMSIGSIFEEKIEINDNLVKWINWSPLKIKKCRECDVLPICFGGCSYKQLNSGDHGNICQEWKYNLSEFLKVFYNANKIKRS